MSKITIVSRDEQALLVDISGCATFKEAIEQLSSSFLSANQLWQEQAMDLNLGSLLLSKPQVAQIIALINGIGAKPNRLFSKNSETISALDELQIEHKSLHDETSQESTKIEQVLLLDTNDNTKEELSTDMSVVQEAPEADTNSKELETRQENILAASKPKSALSTKKKNTLYLKQTLRAGQAVSHKGDLIIIGDVNAGAEVLAEGDITIWGSLRGIAHAGIDGNTKAEIRALRLQPIQIRIASYIARSPDSPTTSNLPITSLGIAAETAKLVNGKIRIVRNTLEW